jgi:alanine dehydrogenase
MGADVTILERAPARIRELEQLFDASARVLMSDTATIEELVLGADLVIGAVLVPGARAPRLLGRSLVTRMRTGAVIVDVAIDQGGCCETSRPTTHMEPTFTVDGVVHYCVTNMPGGVPVTATRALTNATLPYVERLAARPLEALIKQDAGVGRGLNVRRGRICHPEVADAHSLLAGAE